MNLEDLFWTIMDMVDDDDDDDDDDPWVIDTMAWWNRCVPSNCVHVC